MKKEKLPRSLTIHLKYQSRRYGFAKVPEIRLVGKWLEKMGFQHGRKVTVSQTGDQLVITLTSNGHLSENR